jgi:ribosomal protein S13
MRPADIIAVPINVIVDMLLNGEIRLSDLTEEQIEQLPESLKKEVLE